MNPIRMVAVVLSILIMAGCGQSPDLTLKLSGWITTSDKTHLLEKQPETNFGDSARTAVLIEADTTQKFQQMEGFGYALTGGSAMLLKKQLSEENRKNYFWNYSAQTPVLSE